MLVKGAFTSISGSVGGWTGSHNRGGMYFRGRAIPVDPASARQLLMRGIVGGLAAAWRDELTPAERQAWATYSANTPLPGPLGDPRDVGGLPMFIRGNSVREQIGADRIDAAPTSGLPTIRTMTGLALSSTTGLLSFNFGHAPWADTPDAFLAVYASRPVGAGVQFWKGPYRLIGTVEGDGDVAPTSFTGSYEDVWGAVQSGEKVFVQSRVVDETARLSTEMRGFVVAT